MAKKLLLFFSLLFIFCLTGGSFTYADCTSERTAGCTTDLTCPADYYVDGCVGSCGGSVKRTNYWYTPDTRSWTSAAYCCAWDEAGVCTANCTDPCSEVCSCSLHSSETTIANCPSWQICSANVCVNEATCLDPPSNIRYYNDLSAGAPNVSGTNIKLPIKMAWDGVSGATNYQIIINSGTPQCPNQTYYTPGSCSLGQSTNYSWTVKACFDSGCESCGPAASSNFLTSAAPESIAPWDPDWVGPAAETTTLRPTLDWCYAGSPESYLIRTYIGGAEATFSPIGVEKDEEEPVLESKYSDEAFEFFERDKTYEWKVTACATDTPEVCELSAVYSQIWKFTPVTSDALGVPTLISPTDDPSGINAVGLPVNLSWTAVDFAHSYVYELSPAISGSNFTGDTNINLSWDSLSLDTVYSWKVKACWDYDGLDCGDWSSEWKFKTTGAAPTSFSISPTVGGLALIPTKLDWNDVPGAKSYYYEISEDSSFGSILGSGVLLGSNVSLSYPVLRMNTVYYWRVKTCADVAGASCGPPSDPPQSFETMVISIPDNLSPGSDDPATAPDVFWNSIRLDWNRVMGAQSYWYQMQTINPGKVIQTQATVSTDPITGVGIIVSWQVKACIDTTDPGNLNIDDSKVCTNWSTPKYIRTIEPSATGGGLIPCGRLADDPITPYNERKYCQFSDIFLMIDIIFNFLLWKLIPIILVLEVIITGIIFYFSRQMGSSNTIDTVKSLWRATGIGVGIVFFAWLFVNFLLALLGFQVSIFGRWWDIGF